MTDYKSKSAFRFEATVLEDGDAIDLSNASITVAITSGRGSGEKFAEYTLSDAELDITDASNGEAMLELNASDVQFTQQTVYFEWRVTKPGSSIVPIQKKVTFNDVFTDP